MERSSGVFACSSIRVMSSTTPPVCHLHLPRVDSPEMATFLAALLRPFALLLILGALLAVRHAVMRWMPPGWLKRLLLRKV
jgi:hypothetical protein